MSMVFLLLPQIESVLRFIYSEVNQIDVNAKVDKYYVIMDSIFYEYVLESDFSPLVIGKINRNQELEIIKSNKRNRIIETFPTALMHLGYDLFHAADGPRFRDKLSHGEATIKIEDYNSLAQTLLKFILSFVQFHDNKKLPVFDYESIFMNNLKFVRTFNEACEVFERTFATLIVPESLSVTENIFKSELPKLDLKIIKTFFRPLSETQIVKLLLNILENIFAAMKNFSFSCNDFFKLSVERKLSTSRRQTLSHIITSIPNYHRGFQNLLKVILVTFIAWQKTENEDEKLFNDTIKLLKKSLKFSENLVKNFSVQNRNFFVANEKTCEFLQITEKYEKLNL